MLDEKTIKRCFNRNEIGDAELLYHLKKDEYVFDVDEEKWYFNGGTFWSEVKKEPIGHIIGTDVAGEYASLAKVYLDKSTSPKDDWYKLFLEYNGRAYGLRSDARINSVIRRGREITGFMVTSQDWAIDPFDLVVKNGIINLKTGELRQAKPSDYVRSDGPTEFKGLNEPAPRFEQFISEILDGDIEKVKYLQRLLGYAITGDTREKVMPIFVGSQNNGKDTFFKAITFVLGNLAGPVEKDVLITRRKQDNAANPAVYSLRFKRIAIVSETNDGAYLDAGQVKFITGGGELIARELFANLVTWKPQHTIFLMTNFKPRANSEDEALWSRLSVVEFPLSFINNPKMENERLADRTLDGKLWNEASGILAWLVRGCLEWQRIGLNPPQSVIDATLEYRGEEDVLGQFVVDRMELSPVNSIKASELYLEYKDWAGDNGIMAMSNIRFGKNMEKRFDKKSKSDANYYIGIGKKVVITPGLEFVTMSWPAAVAQAKKLHNAGLNIETISTVIGTQYPEYTSIKDIQEMLN